MKILDYIPTGHRNAISRQTLSTLTRLSDRKVRELIAALNANGEPDELIINMQDGKGYFRPGPEEDNLVRTWRAMENSRKLSVNENVRAADAYLGRNKKRKANELDDNQMSLFDFL